jgi:hypothetical protein
MYVYIYVSLYCMIATAWILGWLEAENVMVLPLFEYYIMVLRYAQASKKRTHKTSINIINPINRFQNAV